MKLLEMATARRLLAILILLTSEKTYRHLRHNPREMLATLLDSADADHSQVNLFEGAKLYGYGVKLTVGRALKSDETRGTTLD